MKPAEARKTFHEVPTVKVAAFAEARVYIEEICRGNINPEEVQKMLDRGREMMNNRKNAAKPRPSRLLTMSGDATVVRRPSGVLVSPKYKDL